MKIKIRDKRNKGWFWVDNEYLNGYAKYFGASGAGIYFVLCRHANQGTQQCFPSQETIALKLGITDRTVRKYIKLFERYGLIEITKERKGGRWINNVYTLLDKTEWSTPEEIISDGRKPFTIGNESTSPEESDDSNHRNSVPLNKTNRNNTNITRNKERRIKTTKEKIAPIKSDISKLVATFTA